MIRLTDVTLKESEGFVVATGWLAPESFAHLKTDQRYQRERGPDAKICTIASAIKAHAMVPEIQLGVRSGNYEAAGTRDIVIRDTVYVIDGWQRSNAAMDLIAAGSRPVVRAVLYFNTYFEYELEQFLRLNQSRVKLSSDLLLHGMRSQNPSVELLHDLCLDYSFPLAERVCWGQSMKAVHLLHATQLLRGANILHARFSDYGGLGAQVGDLARMFAKVRVFPGQLRKNVMTYWQVIDRVFKIDQVTRKRDAPFMSAAVTNALSALFASHQDFWNDSALVVPTELHSRMASFPLNGRAWQHLFSGGTASTNLLKGVMIDHLNSGKRTRRLRPFEVVSEGGGNSEL